MTGAPARRRDAVRDGRGVGEPRHARGARPCRAGAGGILPGRDAPHGGLQQRRTWLDEHRHAAGVDVLMFIGGGSASTAGGIKVGTFAVLLLVIVAEMRGDPDANLFDRRLPPAVIRQALSVALLSVAAVVGATLAIAMTSTVHPRPDPVRGHLGVRDRRAVHGHHGGPHRRAAAHPDVPDVRRPPRAGHPGVRPGAPRAPPPVQTSGRTALDRVAPGAGAVRPAQLMNERFVLNGSVGVAWTRHGSLRSQQSSRSPSRHGGAPDPAAALAAGAPGAARRARDGRGGTPDRRRGGR